MNLVRNYRHMWLQNIYFRVLVTQYFTDVGIGFVKSQYFRAKRVSFFKQII